MSSFQGKMDREWLRNGEKKIIVPISSYLTCNRELKKKKNQKIKKHPNGFISSQNGSGEAEKGKKNYRSDQFLPHPEQRIPKQQQKN